MTQLLSLEERIKKIFFGSEQSDAVLILQSCVCVFFVCAYKISC